MDFLGNFTLRLINTHCEACLLAFGEGQKVFKSKKGCRSSISFVSIDRLARVSCSTSGMSWKIASRWWKTGSFFLEWLTLHSVPLSSWAAPLRRQGFEWAGVGPKGNSMRLEPQKPKHLKKSSTQKEAQNHPDTLLATLLLEFHH